MNSYDIRPVSDVHLQQALRLVGDVFMEFEAPEYSVEGIAEFLRYIEFESIKDMLNIGALFMWACFINDTICGVIAVRPSGHISLLFVDSDYHHQGIARALLACAVSSLGISWSLSSVTVNSSPYAVSFYRKVGFIETDIEQTVNGIRFIPMKRGL